MNLPDYSSYLCVDDLLSAQRPLTSKDEDLRVWADEHFFIISHQRSELSLAQVLVDLDLATADLDFRSSNQQRAQIHLRRACRVLESLVEDAVMLAEQLNADAFARFRGRLGTASGAQSPQFRELRKSLGLGRDDSPVYSAFLNLLRREGINIRQLYREQDSRRILYETSELLMDIAQAFWKWELHHVQMVARMVGRGGGTGGSTGLAYLWKKAGPPFPDLWEGREGVNRPPIARGRFLPSGGTDALE